MCEEVILSNRGLHQFRCQIYRHIFAPQPTKVTILFYCPEYCECVRPRLVVMQRGSVPACSAALVDYIWLLGWGLDPSVCVWQMAQCQYANVTTFIQRFGCVCVSEREKEKYRQNRGRVRNVVIMTKTLFILWYASYSRELETPCSCLCFLCTRY